MQPPAWRYTASGTSLRLRASRAPGWRHASPGARGEDPSRSSPGGPVPMLIPATQLRVGMIVQHQNDLWRVMNVVHVTPGNWRGMVQTKLRNLRSGRSEEHTSELQSHSDLVCRLLLEKKKYKKRTGARS